MGAITSLFGGGKKEAAPAPVEAPEVRPADESGSSSAKKIVRAALIETSPLGDLSPVSTGRKKILGN